MERWLHRETCLERLRKSAVWVVQEEVRLLQRTAAAMEAAQDLDELRPLVRRLVREEGATEGEAEAKRRARLVAVRLVAGQGGDVNNTRENVSGWTPTARAAARGEVSVVRALAEAGAIDVSCNQSVFRILVSLETNAS